MMSESQMPTVSAEMSDSIAPLEVTSIPKDATERSESEKEESKLVERPAAPTIVANNMQIAEDVFIADSEIEVFDTDEKEAAVLAEKVITADSAAIVSTNATIAGQQTDALRAANYEAKKEELATVSEGARLSKKAVVGFAQPMPTIESALKIYNQKNYRVALNEFNTLYSQGSITDTVVYYRAMCNYNLKFFADAVVGFQLLSEKAESEFFYDSQWYYALSLVELGRNDEAKAIFEEILQNGSPYRKQATMEIEKIAL